MTDKLRKAAQQIIDAWNYGSPFEKYLVALDEALDHSGETNEMVAPDGYALISIDALKAWGKYGELLNACLFPAEQAEQEPVAWKEFNEWMHQEIPSGTIIGDAGWWASRIYSKFIKPAAPVQQVDLTKDEIWDAVKDIDNLDWLRQSHAVIAKLREKECK